MLDKFWEILIWLWAKLPHFYTLQPDEGGVLLRFGKYIKTYDEGGHYIFHWPVIHTILTLTITRQLIDVDMQDILTLDGKSVCLNASVEYTISNPRKALLEVNDYDENLQEVVGDAFRESIMSLKYRECLENFEDLRLEVYNKIDKIAENQYGIDVLDVFIPTFTCNKTFRLIQ